VKIPHERTNGSNRLVDSHCKPNGAPFRLAKLDEVIGKETIQESAKTLIGIVVYAFGAGCTGCEFSRIRILLVRYKFDVLLNHNRLAGC
jgi:hypothetical protein